MIESITKNCNSSKRLVAYKGIMYDPDSPVLWSKNGEIEVWLTAKQASAREWKSQQKDKMSDICK